MASSTSGTIAHVGVDLTTPSLFDEFPPRVLERILAHVDAEERVRFERVNKRWLEAAAAAWAHCHRLTFGSHSNRPLLHAHVRAFLARCGVHLRALDVSALATAGHLLDADQAVLEIAQQCPNLEELDLSGISASPDTFRALSESLLK